MMSTTVAAPYVRGIMPGLSTAPAAGLRLRPGGNELTWRAITTGQWRTGDLVLDLGCGQGYGLSQLRQRGIRAIGIDPAATPSVRPVVTGRGEHLPFMASTFDGVLAECSLSLMDDPHAALAEIHRVLKPGGCLVATDLFARNQVEPSPCRAGCMWGVVDQLELMRRLDRAGLRQTLWEDHSAALKQLTARILFEFGSLEPLWGCCGSARNEDDMANTLRRLRPGYFLLAARKE